MTSNDKRPTIDRSNLPPYLVPLEEWTPMPEIRASDVGDVLAGVANRQSKGSPESYGAYVVRNVNDEELHESLAALGLYHGRGKLSQKTFGRNFNVHNDSTVPNRVTLHRTTMGTVQALVLPGSTMGMWSEDSERYQHEERNQHTHWAPDLLANQGLVNTDLFSVPDLALRTTVDPKDMVIFDDSQPHLFFSDEARSSTGYWY